jgi:ABC-type Fe3+ transport system permease subunit
MKKALNVALMGVLMVPVLALGVSLATGTMDVSAQITSGTNATGQQSAAAGADVGTIIKNVVNALLYVIGALSVIMLIWGGIRYTTSAGNQNSVTAAKNTILYAIIGLVVAVFAYAIVIWVIDFGGSGTL